MKNWVKIENTLQEWSLESALLQISISTRGLKQALTDPPTSALPGSSVDGIFQARVLEWGAIAFSAPSCWWSLN